MQLPAKTKTITIAGNEYPVSFPTNRQLYAIYSKKALLSKEMYDAINYSMDGNAKYVALIIDTISTFENIMPKEFFKHLNVDNLSDLDTIKTTELVKAYQEQYEPFFNEWTAAIAEALKPVEAKA